MYSTKSIIYVVQLCFIFAKTTDTFTIHTNERDQSTTEAIKNETIPEYEHLNIKVENLKKQLDTGCKGECLIANKTANVSCEVISNPQPYLNVSVKDDTTTKLTGKWVCSFNVKEVNNGSIYGASVSISFLLEVKQKNFFDTQMCIYIGAGALVLLVLLIICVQTCCIIRLRRKAKAARRVAEWSNIKKDNTEDIDKTATRYSKMPGLKKKEVLIPESRESVIYEVLEHVRVAPEPPPLDSLPINKAIHKPSPLPPDSPASTPNRTLMDSLLRRKNKKAEETELGQKLIDSTTSTLNKRTTLDRIKARPRLSLPNEDVYEAMDSPPPVRKEVIKKAVKEKVVKEKAVKEKVVKEKAVKEKVVKEKAVKEKVPKEEVRVFPPNSRPAFPQHANIGNVLNSQLKQVVEKRNRLNPTQPQIPPPNPLPKSLPEKEHQAPIPTQTKKTQPKPNVWTKEATMPKENALPNESTLPKAKIWPQVQMATKERPRDPSQPQDQQLQESQRPGTRPKVTPYNPGLPPPDAPPAKTRTPWGDVVSPKPKPPPPLKPKQLHPLPHPPHEPEHIHVVTEHADVESDDSDEWLYEPLPQYNIYSM